MQLKPVLRYGMNTYQIDSLYILLSYENLKSIYNLVIKCSSDEILALAP